MASVLVRWSVIRLREWLARTDGVTVASMQGRRQIVTRPPPHYVGWRWRRLVRMLWDQRWRLCWPLLSCRRGRGVCTLWEEVICCTQAVSASNCVLTRPDERAGRKGHVFRIAVSYTEIEHSGESVHLAPFGVHIPETVPAVLHLCTFSTSGKGPIFPPYEIQTGTVVQSGPPAGLPQRL